MRYYWRDQIKEDEMDGARSMHCTENKLIKNTGRRAGREIYFLLFCNMTKKRTIN